MRTILAEFTEDANNFTRTLNSSFEIVTSEFVVWSELTSKSLLNGGVVSQIIKLFN